MTHETNKTHEVHEIKLNNYIEGYEIQGYTEDYITIRKTRLVVTEIENIEGIIFYTGKRDDYLKDKLPEASISNELDNIRIITDEEPFTSNWWENEDTTECKLSQQLKTGSIVQKLDGTECRIVTTAINRDTSSKVVIYEIIETGRIITEPIDLFNRTIRIREEHMHEH